MEQKKVTNSSGEYKDYMDREKNWKPIESNII